MSSDFTPESGALSRVIWKNGETQTYSFTFEAEWEWAASKVNSVKVVAILNRVEQLTGSDRQINWAKVHHALQHTSSQENKYYAILDGAINGP